jgi:hypothetical protein
MYFILSPFNIIPGTIFSRDRVGSSQKGGRRVEIWARKGDEIEILVYLSFMFYPQPLPPSAALIVQC